MNKYTNILRNGGFAAVVVGVIVAIAGQKAGEAADRSAQLAATFRNDPFWASAQGDGIGYAVMWVGIVMAVLGAIAVIGWLMVRANDSTAHTTS